MKSLTGRTEIIASVGEKGEVDIKVTRGGMTVNSFSLPREDGIGAADTIEVDKKSNTVSIIDNSGLDGPRVKETFPLEE